MNLEATPLLGWIDPFIFRIGTVGLRWYSVLYLSGFVIAYFVLRSRYRRHFLRLRSEEDIKLLTMYSFYGIVLGARFFQVLFFNPSFYWANPLEILKIWHGGLSFHGGLVGGFLAFWIFCRRFGYSFLNVADEISLCVPIGLGLGRIANFINGELYGRATNLPWGMVFPQGGPESRHPSQLYESVLEGPVLFLIVWSVAKRRPPDGTVVAVCILAYGILRFFVEFVREPEPPLGTILGPFTMGQLLCVPMILFGIGLLFHFRRQRGGRKSERLKVSIKPKKGSPSKTSQSSD